MISILICLLCILLGVCIGGIIMIYRCGFRLKEEKKEVEKFARYFDLWEKWMTVAERKNESWLRNYFEERKIKNVAIYGMGKVGKHLRSQLQKDGIKLSYIVDRDEAHFYYENRSSLYSPEDKLPSTDAVIVTPVYDFDAIKSTILQKNAVYILSLETIFDEVLSAHPVTSESQKE